MPYNPFKKPVGEQLDLNDLNGLIVQGVAEGFYVEYKSTFVKPEKIARSLASFANTYGGWYFIGIETDDENKAKTLCGFNTTQYSDPLSRVRDVARNGLSHMPLLFPQLIQLSGTLSVLAVFIPEGTETPYITNDGRIYRRAADASDPVPEKDRHTIDRLVDRGKKERERFAEFCQDDRVFSQGDSDIPWISIYFQPQPRGLISTVNLMNGDSIEALLGRSNMDHVVLGTGDETFMSGKVPLNAGYVSGESVVLRQVSAERAGFNVCSIRLFTDGAARIHVPIPTLDANLETKEILDLLSRLSKNDESILYANFLRPRTSVLAACYLISFYADWLKDQTKDVPIRLWARVIAHNIWRTVPVFDSAHWITFVKKWGWPISQNDSISIPALNRDPASLEIDDPAFSLQFFGLVGLCLGMPAQEFTAMIFDELLAENQTRTQHQ